MILGCLERPASALWRNHSSGRGSIKMTVSVTPTGLKAQTAEHGLTEYVPNRLTWTGVPLDYPKLFCWIYRYGQNSKFQFKTISKMDYTVYCILLSRTLSLLRM